MSSRYVIIYLATPNNIYLAPTSSLILVEIILFDFDYFSELWITWSRLTKIEQSIFNNIKCILWSTFYI